MGLTDAISLLGSSGAREYGGVCGVFFWGPILLAGILKCQQIMRRPTTSTPGVMSLALVLVAWLFSLAATAAATIADGEFDPWVWGPVVAGLLALLVASFVVGIVALAQYGHHDPPYVQGRAQAIWGIVLSVFMLGLLGSGVVAGAVKARSALNGGENQDTSVRSQQTMEFAHENFRLRVPSEGWAQRRPSELNNSATAFYARARTDTGFMVIAEHDVDATLNTPALAEIAIDNLKGASQSIEVHRREPRRYAGIDGQWIESTAQLQRMRFTYVHWVGVRNGYVYQLIAWGLAKQPEVVREAAEAWCEGFEQISPQAFAGAEPLPPVREPQLGFAVTYSPGWSAWDSLAEDFPAAAAGAVRNPFYATGIVAIPLGDLDPGPEDLASALTQVADIEFPGDEVISAKPIEYAGATGLEITARSRRQEEDYEYRLRSVRRGSMAYLLVAWRDLRAPDETMPVEVLDAIQLFDPASGEPPITEAQRTEHAAVMNRLGLATYRRGEYEAAERAFRRASELNPGETQYTLNLVDALENQQRYADAVALLDERIARAPEDRSLRVRRAWDLEGADQLEDAAREYGALHAEAPLEGSYLEDYTKVLAELDRGADALAAVESALAAAPTRFNQLLKADVLARTERREDEVTHLLDYRDGRATDVEVDRRLIRALRDLERDAEAVAIAEEIIAAGLADASIWNLKGMAELDLKWYAPAQASFEQAVAKAPTVTDYRDNLDYTRNLVGRGSHYGLAQAVEPVALPQALRDALASRTSGDWQPAPGYGGHYELLANLYDPRTGGESRTTRWCTVVLTERAVIDQFSTLEFDFDPLGEDLYVNHVRVLDAEGNVVDEADRESFYVMDDASGGMATQDKTLHVPVPGLRPGRRLEYAVTWRTRPAPEAMDFKRTVMAPSLPTRARVVAIVGDAGELNTWARQGVEEVTAPGLRAWLAIDPPPYERDPFQPPLQTFLPTVVFCGGGKDWDAVAREYLETIRDRLELTDGVRALAERLVEGKTDPEERVHAIARHVQQDYTYKAIEFGRRARIPNAADRVINDRYGDCKDHALLLHQLLRAAGIESYLALTDTSVPVLRDMPTLDQFDHMVVYVPEVAGGLILDTTSKYRPVVQNVPDHLFGFDVFVLDPARPRFLEIPPFQQEPTQVASRREIRIAPSGDAEVEELLELRGYYAGSMRSWLTDYEPVERSNAAQRWLGRYSDLRLQEMEVDGIEDPDAPLTLRLRYTLPGAFHRAGSRWLGELPAVIERDYLAVQPQGGRRAPLYLDLPVRFTSEARLILPPDWTLVAPAGDDASNPFTDFRTVFTPEATGLRMDYTCLTRAGLFPRESYDAYISALDQAVAAAAVKLVAKVPAE